MKVSSSCCGDCGDCDVDGCGSDCGGGADISMNLFNDSATLIQLCAKASFESEFFVVAEREVEDAIDVYIAEKI